MTDELAYVQELIDRPSERLAVELKRWIDPDSAEGQAKIVSAALALRNYGGGYLVIGFDDKTTLPSKENIPPDVLAAFHIDKIQALILRFSSEPFPISIEFPQRDGQLFPVIVVPPGVKTPVASKAQLLDGNKKPLIAINDVYVRSLNSNNTASTTKASWRDWPGISETCFENREADIGRFLRRHLSGLTPDTVRQLITVLAEGITPTPSVEDELRNYLQAGAARFVNVKKERALSLPTHGTWEVALRISGNTSHINSANRDFVNLLKSTNPNLTGWPIWYVGGNSPETQERLYVYNDIWEYYSANTNSDWGQHIDFMWLDPKGRFYLRQALREDISETGPFTRPLKILDFSLPVTRCAEALAVGLAYAGAMGFNPEQTTLNFSFQWSGLNDRELVAWANPNRSLRQGKIAYQNVVTTFVNLRLDTPPSALGDYVDQAVQPLYQVFDGFSLGKKIVDELTNRLLLR